MRTLKQLLKQPPVFLNNWSNKEGVLSSFAGYDEDYNKVAIADEWKDVNVLFASYGTDNYSGDAFVMFERDGKLYEVNGSHCSCYGLEGQWSPEETTLEAIKHRLVEGTFGVDDWSGNNFALELKEFLKIK